MLFNPISLFSCFCRSGWPGIFCSVRPAIWRLSCGSRLPRWYSFSNRQFVPLLLASVAFNYAIGLLLISKRLRPVLRFAVLTIGVTVDLLVLGTFKYASFLAANLNAIFSTGFTLHPDCVPGRRLQGKCRALRAAALCAVRHLFPASDRRAYSPPQRYDPAVRPDGNERDGCALVLCGLIMFAIGLFKKTCLADGIQPYVAMAFGPVIPSFDQAWIGALAYTFQLYFDFSATLTWRSEFR
jgi:alginate O-acetyltransferase complex protein AlgI